MGGGLRSWPCVGTIYSTEDALGIEEQISRDIGRRRRKGLPPPKQESTLLSAAGVTINRGRQIQWTLYH